MFILELENIFVVDSTQLNGPFGNVQNFNKPTAFETTFLTYLLLHLQFFRCWHCNTTSHSTTPDPMNWVKGGTLLLCLKIWAKPCLYSYIFVHFSMTNKVQNYFCMLFFCHSKIRLMPLPFLIINWRGENRSHYL